MEKNADPARLSWGETYFYFPVGIRLSLHQSPVAKNWCRTDSAHTQRKRPLPHMVLIRTSEKGAPDQAPEVVALLSYLRNWATEGRFRWGAFQAGRSIELPQKLSDWEGYATSPIRNDLIRATHLRNRETEGGARWDRIKAALSIWKSPKLSSSGGGVARSVRFLC